MGIMVCSLSLLWVMQALYHQPYHPWSLARTPGRWLQAGKGVPAAGLCEDFSVEARKITFLYLVVKLQVTRHILLRF